MILEIITGRILFNYVGATVRWIYGSIWRTIFNKPKFTYDEYVNGPKNSTDYYDLTGHEFNNRFIGLLVIMTLLLLIL